MQAVAFLCGFPEDIMRCVFSLKSYLDCFLAIVCWSQVKPRRTDLASPEDFDHWNSKYLSRHLRLMMPVEQFMLNWRTGQVTVTLTSFTGRSEYDRDFYPSYYNILMICEEGSPLNRIWALRVKRFQRYWGLSLKPKNFRSFFEIRPRRRWNCPQANSIMTWNRKKQEFGNLARLHG